MKLKTAAQAILMTAGLTGCGHVNVEVSKSQSVELDPQNRIVVATEGIDALQTHSGMSAPRLKAGEPIHRILTDGDGKVLFAYDLDVKKGNAGGTYRLQLKPSADTPTFASAREVVVKARDEQVRVELMEQPGTGRKIVDVFTLLNSRTSAAPGIHTHLQALHEMIRKSLFGD